MTNPFPLKMAGFELPASGQFSLPGDMRGSSSRPIPPRVREDGVARDSVIACIGIGPIADGFQRHGRLSHSGDVNLFAERIAEDYEVG